MADKSRLEFFRVKDSILPKDQIFSISMIVGELEDQVYNTISVLFLKDNARVSWNFDSKEAMEEEFKKVESQLV